MSSLRLAPDRLHHPVSPPSSAIALPSFFSRLRTSAGSKGLLTVKNHARRWTLKILNKRRRRKPSARLDPPSTTAEGRDVAVDILPDAALPTQPTSLAQSSADWSDADRLTINILPDDALLEIFDFYLGESKWTNRWHILVHVCRRWRLVVFGSPRRLNLQLVCTHKTPVRRKLDIWLPFPIVLRGNYYSNLGKDNIIATLENNDRVCEIDLRHISSSLWENVLSVMQEPFPILTDLKLLFTDNVMASVVPDSFLDGSTPRLRKLVFDGIPFPGLPKLLLSAAHLVHLQLLNIPHSGYFTPESMVTCLLTLIRLEFLTLKFESPQPRSDRENRRLPPPTRTLLPSLTHFTFKGVGEYLEDIVAWVDAPLLDYLDIIFFRQLIFDTPQLAQFVSRIPKLNTQDQAHVTFSDWGAFVTLPRTYDRQFQLAISCTQPDWHVLSMAQVCNSALPPFSTLERLYISDRGSTQQRWQDDIENLEWLELLRPFTAVKKLYLAEEYAPHIISALQEVVGERVTEVLPALECLFVEKLRRLGPIRKAIEQLLDVRQLSNHPILISFWNKGERDW